MWAGHSTDHGDDAVKGVLPNQADLTGFLPRGCFELPGSRLSTFVRSPFQLPSSPLPPTTTSASLLLENLALSYPAPNSQGRPTKRHAFAARSPFLDSVSTLHFLFPLQPLFYDLFHDLIYFLSSFG